MGKVRQKVSGCFRIVRGAEVFCTLRTVICTARKQGWSVIETLMKPSGQLIAQLRFG
jgi:transposase